MDITYKKVSFHRAQCEEPHRMLTYNHISTLYPSAAELDEKKATMKLFLLAHDRRVWPAWTTALLKLIMLHVW